MATTYKIIDKAVLGSDQANITFTGLNAYSSDYTDLRLLVSSRVDTGSGDYTNMLLQFNSSTSNYYQRFLAGNGSSPDTGANSGGFSGFVFWYGNTTATTSNTFASADIYIPNAYSSNYKSVSVDGVTENNATSAFAHMMAGTWQDTSAISSIKVASFGGQNLKAGTSVYLYGIKNS